MDTTKYINTRKRLLREYRKKIVKRAELNREIRNVRSELNGWDNYLLNEED